MEDNKHSFMDHINLFLVGAGIGLVIGACFGVNVTENRKEAKAEEKLKAFEQYYTATETLLDSLDGTHNLNLMDTDLATDYGVDYLDAKSKVDSLIVN